MQGARPTRRAKKRKPKYPFSGRCRSCRQPSARHKRPGGSPKRYWHPTLGELCHTCYARERTTTSFNKDQRSSIAAALDALSSQIKALATRASAYEDTMRLLTLSSFRAEHLLRTCPPSAPSADPTPSRPSHEHEATPKCAASTADALPTYPSLT